MLVDKSCLILCDDIDCSLPGSISIWFSRQEYWSGLPFPSPGDLSNPRIKPTSPAVQPDSLSEPPGKSQTIIVCVCVCVCVCVLVTQPCLTLWDLMNYSLRGSSVHGILWTLESFPFQGIFLPRVWTQVFCIAGRLLPSEPPGKPIKWIASGNL